MTTPVTTTLRGITWEHARGFDCQVAAASEYERRTGVRVEWEARSLQAFADAPLEVLTADYDLLVIDHPHVPLAAEAGLLARLDGAGHDEALAALAADSVGASQYLETVHGLEAGRVPALDLGLEQRVIDGTLALIRAGLTTTAHDCAEGGLAVALAEMAIAGGRGLKVSLNAPADVRADALLFGEAHSRVVVAVPVGREGEAEARLAELNVPFALLGDAPGQAGADELGTVTIALPAHNVHLSVNLETLKTAFESPLTEILG